MNASARAVLRKELRAARRSLSPAQQRAAARRLAGRLCNWLPLIGKKHIAFYWPNDGEIDPRLLMSRLEKRGKCCYLPRLYADGSHRVAFKRYRTGDSLYKNRFGIPEPAIKQPTLPVWALQAVLMPLVGFDQAGNRLGMGGGFYDRSFAFKRRTNGARPQLIGLAHSIQQVERLSVQGWDIPVETIVTEREIFRINK